MPPDLDRRTFVASSIGGLLASCAPAGRGFAPYLDPRWSSFHDHLRWAPDSVGGIDYGPLPSAADTLVSPVAAGVVIATVDAHGVSGMVVTIAHGLGWKTIYGHLQARFVADGERVQRREIIAVMGASGWGASRGGLGVAHHLHLTLWGPAWAGELAGAAMQRRPAGAPGFRHALDPEAFSLAAGSYLPYSRAGDAALDDEFLALHAEAVRVADELLAQFDDRAAASARMRSRFERDTEFDYDVDQRIGFLRERLERGPHPFTADAAREHRATLLRFTRAVPRLTSPIVEARRRGEYLARRAEPLKTYDARGF